MRPVIRISKPGGTRTFTIKHMNAGHYVVVCNIAGHYAHGHARPIHGELIDD